MTKINLDGLTESEGFDLFHRLKAKFDWAGTVTSMGDVPIYRQGEEEWADNPPELTEAMREVVRSTYEWERGIEDYMAEKGNEFAPRIEVLPNGNFVVHVDSDSDSEYTADGEEIF